jgi:hypothetical protein
MEEKELRVLIEGNHTPAATDERLRTAWCKSEHFGKQTCAAT